MRCHLLLVGLPGAGKSTVGSMVAEILGVPAYDVDEILAEQERCTVARIITERGEAEFRRLEKLQTDKVLAGPRGVVIPGGGWAAEGEGQNLQRARDRAYCVYLYTSAATAAGRLAGTTDRPLLNGEHPAHPVYHSGPDKAEYH